MSAQQPRVRLTRFRKVLVHRYAHIDDALVWEVATRRVPQFAAIVDELMAGPRP
jgi:uncharacterized protein YutE (UPF0331/DUF86 family)